VGLGVRVDTWDPKGSSISHESTRVESQRAHQGYGGRCHCWLRQLECHAHPLAAVSRHAVPVHRFKRTRQAIRAEQRVAHTVALVATRKLRGDSSFCTDYAWPHTAPGMSPTRRIDITRSPILPRFFEASVAGRSGRAGFGLSCPRRRRSRGAAVDMARRHHRDVENRWHAGGIPGVGDRDGTPCRTRLRRKSETASCWVSVLGPCSVSRRSPATVHFALVLAPLALPTSSHHGASRWTS